MARAVLCLAVALVCLTCCTCAFPMASEYQLDMMMRAADEGGWIGQANPVRDLLLSQKPAYAYWVNSLDYFYYSGDTKAFNEFLERYSKLPEPSAMERPPQRWLVLHVGSGETKTLLEGKPLSYDWSVTGSDFFAFVPAGQHPAAALELEVWIGCHIQLDQLKVPLNIELKSGGEIEKLIEKHQAAQRAGDKPLPHMPEKPQVDGTVER